MITKEQKISLTKGKWEPLDASGTVKSSSQGLRFINVGKTSTRFIYKDSYDANNNKIKALHVVCYGDTSDNAAGYVTLNGFEICVNGEAALPITPPLKITLEVIVNAESSLVINELIVNETEEEIDLCANTNKDADVLVVVPAYPSYKNLYLSAFAHARNKAYHEAGINIQVAALGNEWYSMMYSIDGIQVFRGCQADLKKLLSKKQYKAIVIHFVDENLFPILDGYVTTEKLVFICHGPETLFEVLPNKVRPYFTKPLPPVVENDYKKKYIKKYAGDDRVEWVFVSDWLKEESESVLGVSFKNTHIIGNFINDRIFGYVEKEADDRKKILIIRKFDNVCQHSIDQVVLAIRELSRRPFFDDLQFSIYGDGNYYEELISPIREFPNIEFHKSFLPQKEIAKVHRNHGILLIPSRHDAHAVSMSEGASSGLVVVGSNVTSNPFFMDDEHNHTMVDPENYVALADVIERLYYNPDEFKEISKRLSEYVHTVSSRENTINREIDVIKNALTSAKDNWGKVPTKGTNKIDPPILTVLVAAYNVEPWLNKCLYSLVNHRNAGRIEILVVNDGSRDGTSDIAHLYERETNGVVRVIDKENGGHGSTINRGIQEAKGKYFRIVDGDDWVDSESFATFIDYLDDEDADIVLTEGSYEYADKTYLAPIIEYNMLTEGVCYNYDDLLFPAYGFDYYGPLLPTATYKTDKLRDAKFSLSEKKPYVDMEFNAFSQRYIKTLSYYKLDIYRYLIGREGQTVSRDVWKTKYRVHAEIIINILETIDKMEDFPKNRKTFIYKHLIAMMVDSQIFMFDQVGHREEIDDFLEKLAKWPAAREASLDYIKGKNVESQIILENYKKIRGDEPIIQTDGRMRESTRKGLMKKCLKAVTPYGLLWARRKVISRS